MKKFLVLLLASAAAAAAVYFWYNSAIAPQIQQESGLIISELESYIVNEILLDPGLIVDKNSGERLNMTARMPLRYKTADVKALLEKYVSSKNRLSADYKEINTEKIQTLVASVSHYGKLIAKVRFARNDRPKLAIILDDWGYSKKNFPYLSGIKQPFSAAVLPNLAYSKAAAEAAFGAGKGPILHLPMQPKKNMRMEKNTIKINMSEDEVRYIIDRQLDSVPLAAGINNHEGSLVTESSRILEILMKELKSRKMFFVDSLTTDKSIAYGIAKKQGVHAVKRDVFLDNKNDAEYIKGQLEAMKKVARKKGYALALGHDRATTLAVLAEQLPLLEAEGFEVVRVQEILQ